MTAFQADNPSFASRLAAAFTSLGQGLLAQPQNQVLRQRLQSGALSAAAYYTQLRHLAYRLLLLSVAEARGVLPDPGASRGARQRYQRSYALGRAPHLTASRGSPSRYQRLLAALHWLSGQPGGSEAAIPCFGAFLAPAPMLADLVECTLPDSVLNDFLQAVLTALQSHPRLPGTLEHFPGDTIDYLHLATRAWQPVFETPTCAWHLLPEAGTSSATAGTRALDPTLLELMLDSALEPAVQEALAQPDPEAALLALRIADPACGTGTVLRAAARRLAHHLVHLRGGTLAAALHAVLQHCLYGVDKEATRVELCRLGLLLEVLAPGTPVPDLEQHIRCGDSLLGTTPLLLARGIPDEAFRAVADDAPSIALALRKRNQQERQGQMQFHFTLPATPNQPGRRSRRRPRAGRSEAAPAPIVPGSAAHALLLAHAWCAAFVWPKTPEAVPVLSHDTLHALQVGPEHVPQAIQQYITELAASYGFCHWHLAFPQVFTPAIADQEQPCEQRLTGWSGGFDVLLSRLPWGTLAFDAQAWGVQAHPELATAPTASARRSQLEAWCTANPVASGAMHAARQQAARRMHLLRHTAAGSQLTSTSQLSALYFIVCSRLLVRPTGRIGYLLPVPGLLRERGFMQTLLEQQALASFASVSNASLLLPWLPRSTLIGLLTLRGSQRSQPEARVAWLARQPGDLADPDRYAPLQAADLRLLNPHTRAWPALRSAPEARLLRTIYRHCPIFRADNTSTDPGWQAQGRSMLQLTRDAALLRTPEQLEAEGWRFDGERFRHGQNSYLPVYEGPMLAALTCPTPQRLPGLPRYWIPAGQVVQHTTHVPEALVQAYAHKRPDAILKVLASWVGGYHLSLGHQHCTRDTLVQTYNPMFQALPGEPAAWSAEISLAQRWPLRPADVRLLRQQHDVLLLTRQLITQRCPDWLVSWRERLDPTYAVQATVVPRAGLAQTAPWLCFPLPEAPLAGCLVANLSSLVLAFCVRQKILGARLTPALLDELPVLAPSTYTAPCAWDRSRALQDWLMARLLPLLYTGQGLGAWARACGYQGAPFREAAEQRARYRSEIEAAYCHLYGLSRADVLLLLATMTGAQQAGRTADWPCGERLVQRYDALHAAMAHGTVYRAPGEPLVPAPVIPESPPPAPPVQNGAARLQQLLEPPPEERYKRCLPLLDLAAVVNAFAEGYDIEPETWIVLPAGRSLRPGMFVTRMVGSAMAPQIPDQAYCLFERQSTGNLRRLQGRIVLVQHPDIHDPDIDGSYTIRRYVPEHGAKAQPASQASLVRLLPLHADYAPIVLTLSQRDTPHVIAEFLSVLDEAESPSTAPR
ncbi:MAG: hypothetical protein AB7N91_04910 [Candidatus Tectimicrobiota bacterium]